MPKWESLYRMGMPRWKKNEAAVVEQRRLAFQDYLNEVLCSTTSTVSGQAAARTPAGPNCLNEVRGTHRHRRACNERACVTARVVQASVLTRPGGATDAVTSLRVRLIL